MARTPTLPRRGNYDYLELPVHLQRLIEASESLHDAAAALDSVERALRVLEDSNDAADREAWRWAQARSLESWRLYWRTQEHTELLYLAWITERDDEERLPTAEVAQGE